MDDTKKTKADLLRELREARRLLVKLRASEARHRTLEDSLRQSRDFVQAVIDGIGDPTLVIDIKNHAIVLSNAAAREMAGAALAGAPAACYQATHHRDRPCEEPEEPCPINRVLAEGAPVRVTHRHYTSAGEEVIVDIMAAPVFGPGGEVVQIIESCRDVTRRVRAEEEKERLIGQLREALVRIRTLQGLIPICAWCRKVRDDRGYWEQLEKYVVEHSEADFTHGICPECLKKVEAREEKRMEKDRKKAGRGH
jgi:hypothetical protein